MPPNGNYIQRYLCIPHEKELGALIEDWKGSVGARNLYFVTATFSHEGIPYFPNRANHYILASSLVIEPLLEDLKITNIGRMSFMLTLTTGLFERAAEKLNYISIYFTKYTYNNLELTDIANVIARRERVKKASLATMSIISTENVRFVFPYSRNVIVLEVEGEKTHQSDQKYCEQTRRDVSRKGIPLSNLISLSILEKLK